MNQTPDLAAALTRAAGPTSTKPAAADRKVLLVRLDPAVHRRLRVLSTICLTSAMNYYNLSRSH